LLLLLKLLLLLLLLLKLLLLLLLLTLLPQPLLLLTLLPQPLLLLTLLPQLRLLLSKLHGSAKKAGPRAGFFLVLSGYMPDLPLKNLAPTKPIPLIGHPDPFRVTI